VVIEHERGRALSESFFFNCSETVSDATSQDVTALELAAGLIIILFESGIGLHISELLKTMRPALTLTVVNFLAATIIVGGVTWAFGAVDPKMAFMLGAIVGGTSSAVVIPLVSQLKLESESKSILILESALSDVLCIVFALAFLQAQKMGSLHVGPMIGQILSSFLLAAAIGIGAAYVWSILLNKLRSFRNSIFTTPAFVFIVFAVTELLGFSGAIASLAFGIGLGNAELLRLPILKRFTLSEPLAPNQTEKAFFSEIVFLFKTFFFIYIGLSIQFSSPSWLLFGIDLTLLMFFVRIPVVRLTMPRTVTVTDASYMAAIVPKGLAAAVLASLALQQGIVGGEFIQNVTYSVILFSIVCTSALVFLLDKTRLAGFYGRLIGAVAREKQSDSGRNTTSDRT
jgi:potassium/hydrogen antiporter